MRKVAIALFILSLTATFAFGQVNVTFQVNSSTVEGWTDSTTTVQIRGGEHNLENDSWYNNVLQWSAESEEAMNVGGDYWEATVAFPDSMIGWEIPWKIGATLHNPDGTSADFWEDVPGGGNRNFILPDTDTTLTQAYVSNLYDPPYTPTDSIDVYFRVNMGAHPDFNPEADNVYIVGAFPHPSGADNMWVPDAYALTREGPESDYFSYHLPLDPAGASYDSVMYRFTLGSWDQSEQVYGHGMFPDNENRGTSAHNDTTVSWKWWNDTPPAGFEGQDSVDITFFADMTKAINTNGFEIGDTLLVRYGYEGSSSTVETDTLLRQAGTQNYFVTVDSVPASVGDPFYYQYYLYKDGTEYREIYYNYEYTGTSQGGAERREYVIESSDAATIQDNVDSQTDPRRMPVFRNTETVSQDVLVTLECDLRPAYFQVLSGTTLEDIQGDMDVTDADSVYAWGVAVNGPLTGGWNNQVGPDWGPHLMDIPEKALFDDGTHGDAEAGDHIYTNQYQLVADSSIIGQEFKFGVGGGDNEGGEGGYGNNHVQNIDDSESTFTLRVQFGSINPNFYDAWNYNTQEPVAIDDEVPGVVNQFALEQNYPNPFNPKTTFNYTIPNQTDVNIAIYNIVGQKVYTQTTSAVEPGSYEFTWNGVDNENMSVSSGVYFYQITAGEYTATKKMVLMK